MANPTFRFSLFCSKNTACATP